MSLSASAEDEGSEPRQASDLVHEDKEYRFRLTLPDAGWSFLKPDDAAPFLVGLSFLVGLQSPDGAALVIAARRVEDAEEANLAALMKAIPPSARRHVVSSKPLVVQGFAAHRVEMLVKSERVQAVATWILRNGFLFVVGVTVPHDPTRKRYHEDLFRTLTLLPGTVVGRPRSLLQDRAGLDWEFKEQRYRDAALRVAADVPDGWNAISGEDRESAYLVVELWHEADDLSIRIAAAPTPPAEAARAEAALLAAWLNGSAATEDERQLNLRIGGAEVPWLVSEADEGYARLVATNVVEDRCILIDVIYPSSSETAALRKCRGVPEAVTLLPKEEAYALGRRLKSDCKRGLSISKSRVIRADTFRDFVHAFVLRAPSARLWHLRAKPKDNGDAPPEIVELEERSLGVRGDYAVKPRSALSAQAFHGEETQGALGLAQGAAPGEVRKIREVASREIKVRDRAWLVSEEDCVWDGELMRCRVVTTTRGTKGHCLRLYGRPWCMRAAVSELDDFVNGLELSTGISVKGRTGTAYTDFQFGYRLEPPANWRRVQARLPNELDRAGGSVRWIHLRGTYLVSVSVRDVSLQSFRKRLSLWGSGVLDDQAWESGTKSVTKLDGIEAEQYTWKAGEGVNALWTVERGPAYYLVALVSFTGFTPEEIEAYKKRFSFVD